MEFSDWKHYVQTHFNIRKKDISGEPVHWQKMSWIRFESRFPKSFQFKETFEDDEFKCIDCSKNIRQSSHGILQSLYKKPKCISRDKYNNLMSLFATKPPAVSMEYYNFYANLSYSNIADGDE